MRALATILVALLACGPALAVNPDEVLSDPAMEERARQLSKGLRCVVCQNQSIDDSDADLARDMRLLVRERLEVGDTDEEVRRFMVARYGEFVLLRPELGSHTIALWAAPALFVVAGGIVVWRRRRAPIRRDEGLTPEEERELARLTERDA